MSNVSELDRGEWWSRWCELHSTSLRTVLGYMAAVVRAVVTGLFDGITAIRSTLIAGAWPRRRLYRRGAQRVTDEAAVVCCRSLQRAIGVIPLGCPAARV